MRCANRADSCPPCSRTSRVAIAKSQALMRPAPPAIAAPCTAAIVMSRVSASARSVRPSKSADACARFCRGLVDAVAPYVVGVKPQVAFFEALGADGMRALEDVCAYSRAAGLQVIAVPHPRYPPEPAALRAARLVLAGLDGLTAQAVAEL